MSDFGNIRHPKKRAFLAAYSKAAVIVYAAKAAGIDRQTHANWLKKDKQYAAAFEQAREDAIETMELEALRRATKGCERPIYQGGKKVGSELQYSDTLLIFLLKAARPRTYRENVTHEVSGPDGGPIRTRFEADIARQLSADPEAVEQMNSLARRLTYGRPPSDN